MHEFGHVLGLGHAARQCVPSQPGYRQCCQASPNGNDVMSYCRARGSIAGEFYFGFKECALRFLREEMIPRLLEGGIRPRQQYSCD
jgi:hypothetical protein